MKYSLEVAPSVTRQASRVYIHRETERKGAGERFVAALAECYAAIKANPYGYQLRKGNFRHAQLRRLFYRVVYEVEGDRIYVHQLRHTSRRVSRRFGP
ncbi:MAG: type II toxin-antitoxin system RelE/ParE family toxin [Flavobacteriales bacterium]|nr:type II toxin-antitoxin system RelE/ParE family toxin [Flavobacteriales bacterium]MCC6938684.1 type II toxin-antitoxin system RelE/ParE family toxin [Flavobacteriales bacterium]